MIFFDFFYHHEKEISTIKSYVREKKHFTNNSDSLRLARIGLGLNKR